MRRVESARTSPGSREAEDPGSALLGRHGAPRALEAFAARPRGQPVTAIRSGQESELPGQAGGRPGLTEEGTALDRAGRREAPRTASESGRGHVGHSVAKATASGTIVTKSHPDSPHKIDAAVAAIVALERAAYHASVMG